jgi:hypothetical protein
VFNWFLEERYLIKKTVEYKNAIIGERKMIAAGVKSQATCVGAVFKKQ